MKHPILASLTLPFALGCAALPLRAPVQPPIGALFTLYRAPLQTDMEETRLGSQHGTASVHYVHDVLLTGINLAWGEADIESAAQSAGIQTVTHADYELLSVLGIYMRFTVHTYGD